MKTIKETENFRVEEDENGDLNVEVLCYTENTDEYDDLLRELFEKELSDTCMYNWLEWNSGSGLPEFTGIYRTN